MTKISEGPSSFEVQFHSVGGSNLLILIPVYINGTGPYDFVLDSGATRSTVSSGLARSLAMDADFSEQAFGVGGAFQMPSTVVRKIQVGPACQENSRVFISNDLEQIGAAAKSKIDGLIGFDFIRHYKMTIDYPGNRLCFGTSLGRCHNAISSTASTPFTITPVEALILLPATVNGHGPFQFVLDTAAGRTVVAPELVEQCGIQLDREVIGAGAGGQLTTRRVNLESLSVGDATIRKLTAIVGQFLDPIAAAVGAQVHGILGNDVLSRFMVTIDCLELRLVLDSVHESIS